METYLMSDRKIKVTINPLGIPVIEAVGFNGVGCEAATANIEAALSSGDTASSKVIKDEWHNDAGAEQHQEQW